MLLSIAARATTSSSDDSRNQRLVQSHRGVPFCDVTRYTVAVPSSVSKSSTAIASAPVPSMRIGTSHTRRHIRRPRLIVAVSRFDGHVALAQTRGAALAGSSKTVQMNRSIHLPLSVQSKSSRPLDCGCSIW